MNVKQIKKNFPIFQRKVNGKKLVYLDSASTSQKPKAVIDAINEVYKNYNSNIHRGIYTISEEATEKFEETREKAAKFINARSSLEIVFTHNTTEALNLVAYGLGKSLKKGDAILISEMEHHSNITPWQRVAKEKGAKLFFLMINDPSTSLRASEGLLTTTVKDENDKVVYKNFLEIPRLKIVSLVHVSNVLGTVNPIEQMIKDLRLKIKDIRIVIDGAQSVPHMPVDVQKLDCDFLAFSGHKMLGPTGVGVLYGKKELLEEMEPLLIGSHMIKEVTKKGSIWNVIPWKFEPGTAAIEAVVGLGAAIDYLNKIGMDNIKNHESRIMNYGLEQLTKIKGLTVYGPTFAKASAGKPKNVQNRGGVISFNINGIHSHDVAQILDSDGICIRSGHHCAQPLHKCFNIDSSARASFYLYNDEEDIDKLVEGIKKVKKVFKV